MDNEIVLVCGGVTGESDRDTDGKDGYVYHTSSPNLYLYAPVGALPRRD